MITVIVWCARKHDHFYVRARVVNVDMLMAAATTCIWGKVKIKESGAPGSVNGVHATKERR